MITKMMIAGTTAIVIIVSLALALARSRARALSLTLSLTRIRTRTLTFAATGRGLLASTSRGGWCNSRFLFMGRRCCSAAFLAALQLLQ